MSDRVEQWFSPADGLAFAVRLLNSWDEYDPDPERLPHPGAVDRFLQRHGLEPGADETDLAALRVLRSRLATAWDAATDGEAVEILNRVLADAPVPARLARAGETWELRYDRPGEPASRWAPALAASGLLEEIRTHGRLRLGRCAAGPCRCPFVDRSKNRSRKFCCDLCADRFNQAAARARRAASRESPRAG
jgi:predicted RNA-binding Zn ribbon-like protein